jgi:mannosyl-glycoprotein endo-beta-N-acetylglucosaminidase
MKNIGKAAIISTGLLFGGTYTLIPYSTSYVEASGIVRITATTYLTTDNLNLRSGAGTGYKTILTIPKGKKVTATERIDNWYHISYNYSSNGKTVTTTGWVLGSYLSHYHQYTTIASVKYSTKNDAYLYPTPDTGRAALFKVSSNYSFYTTEKVTNSHGDTLYGLTYQGQKVYVKATDVTEVSDIVTFPTTTYKTSARISLRSGAGNNYSIVSDVPEGSIVTSSERIGNWYRVQTSNASGWVWGSYLTHHHQYTTITDSSFVTTKSAYLYPTPDTGRAALFKVGSNFNFSTTQKVVNSRGETLYRLIYQDKTVYIKSTDAAQVTSSEKFPTITYKTTANISLRSGAGNNYGTVANITSGTIVTSSERNGNWYKVQTSNANGWVWGSYLAHHHQYSTITSSSFVTNNSAYLYPTPDTGRAALYKVDSNYKFSTTEKVLNSRGETLYGFTYEGKEIYIKAEDVAQITDSITSVKFSTIKYTTSSNLNLRSGAGTDYSIVTTLPQGTIVTSSERIDNWYKVQTANASGWVLGSYLSHYHEYIDIESSPYVTIRDSYLYPTPDTGAAASFTVGSNYKFYTTQQVLNSRGETLYRLTYSGKTVYIKSTDVNAATDQSGLKETAISGKTFVTTSNLNLRTAADPNSTLLTTIPSAAFVIPTHFVSNGWYKVSYAGKTGYVSGGYIKEVVTGDPFHRNGYQFIDLRKPSIVTAAQIDNYINSYISSTGKASVLKNQGQSIINAGNKYGVNSLYLAAHAILESGYGTSNISIGKYNLFGFGAYDATPFIGAVRFTSIQQNIDYIAQEMKASYLNPSNWKYKGPYLGYSTQTVDTNTRIDENSAGMNFYYASDPKWGQKIAAHMENILPYNKADYGNAVIDTRAFEYPARPSGSDVFPAGIKAVANQTIKLATQKGGTLLSVPYIAKGGAFEIQEKHNDYWVKVYYNNSIYWTNSIKFDRYKEFLSVKNLGRVTTTTLNVRPTPSTSQSPIAALSHNQFIHLELDAFGYVIMDSTKTWYKIKLANGTSGWVHSDYVYRELM